MSHSPTIPVVTIRLNKSNRDEDDMLSICSENSSLDSNYNFKNRYSSLDHYSNDDEETTFVRLNRRSFSSLDQFNSQNNLSVRVNMNRSSPIYEEKSDDCQSDNEVTATYKLNNNSIHSRKSSIKENGKIMLRKSSTVIQCIDMNENEDESEESVSYSFKRPTRKDSNNSSAMRKSNDLNSNYSSEYDDTQKSNGNHYIGDKAHTDELSLEKSDDQKTQEERKQFFIGKYKDIDEMLGNLFKMIEDTSQTLNAEELMEDFYEIEASAVKIHDNKALNAKVEEYKEEIDSSAVRIRVNKVFSTELQEIREEMDSVQIRQNRPTKGEFIVKNKDNSLINLNHVTIVNDYWPYKIYSIREIS